MAFLCEVQAISNSPCPELCVGEAKFGSSVLSPVPTDRKKALPGTAVKHTEDNGTPITYAAAHL
jgi:hypothetical protein